MNPPNLSPAILLLLLLLLPSSSLRLATATATATAAASPPQCNDDFKGSPNEKAPVAAICSHAADPEGCVIVVRYLSGGGVKSTDAVSVVRYHLDACTNAVTRAKEETVERMNKPGTRPEDKNRLKPTVAACDDAILSIEQARTALQKAPADTDQVLDNMRRIPALAMGCERTDTTLASGYVDNAFSVFKKYWHIPSSAFNSSTATSTTSHAQPGSEYSAARVICDATTDTLTCLSFVRNAEFYDRKSIAGLTNASAVLRIAVKTTIAETKSAVKKIKAVVAEQRLGEKAKVVLKGCAEELMEAVLDLDDARDAMERDDDGASGHLELARGRIKAGRQVFNLNLFALDSSAREADAQQKLWEHLDYLVAAADVVMDLAGMLRQN